MSEIYLLGGTSNAGKSTCARQLAAQFRLVHVEVDTVRGPLQAAAPKADPLRYFLDSNCQWLDLTPAVSLKHKTDVARRTCRQGVEPLLERLLVAGRDALVEGDDLLPEFVEVWVRAGVAGAAFLIETDPNVIRERYWERDQTLCIAKDDSRLDRFVPHYLAWARWLQDEADLRNLPVVDARGRFALDDLAVALGLKSPR